VKQLVPRTKVVRKCRDNKNTITQPKTTKTKTKTKRKENFSFSFYEGLK